ncbi:MAG: LamG-like jellyroll fold domain-containing protein [Sedimentisphaerales bacterium]
MKKIVLVFIWLLFAFPCQARIITVDDDGPADFDNIQAAINDANNGDIIEVKPGTYTGAGNRDIDYNGKAITIRSIDPNNPDIVAATIIDCNGTEEEPHRGFHFHAGEDANSVLAGLTIMNGYAENGGSIYISNSGPTIMQCKLKNNSTYRYGSALYCYNGSPTLSHCAITGNLAFSKGAICCINSNTIIRYCTITNNSANWDGSVYYYESGGIIEHSNIHGGRGLHCEYCDDLTISNCLITNNYACTAFGDGGGICCIMSNPKITNCRIENNNAHSGDGGGIYCSGNPEITNCVFNGNIAKGVYGGGAYMIRGNPVFVNCAFIRNFALERGGGVANQASSTFINCLFEGNSSNCAGGGISNLYNCEAILKNCTFAGNSAPQGRAIECYTHNKKYPSKLWATNCIMWDGGDEIWYNQDSEILVTYSDIKDGWQGSGNIDVEPGFAYPGFPEPIPGTVAHWRLDEGSGTTVHDSIGENHGVIHEAVWTSGRIDGALEFYGSGYVDVPEVNGLNLEKIYTVSAWIKAEPLSSGYNVIVAYSDRTGSSILFQLDQDWRGIKFLVRDRGARTATALRNAYIGGDEWHNVVGVREGNDVNVFRNGIKGFPGQNIYGLGEINTNDFKIGAINRFNQGPDHHFSGNIDDVRIFNRRLSDEEIKELYYCRLIDFGDYHLLPDSPCIDAGDPNYIPEPNETDLDGRSRIFGNRIDMGVYEYSPTIQAEARIVPRTINLASKGNWITCYVWLPEQYNVVYIEPNSVILENEIQAVSLSVDEQEQVAIARFSREDFQSILDVGEVELTITGQFTDGTIFEAKDTIKVTDKGGGKPVK